VAENPADAPRDRRRGAHRARLAAQARASGAQVKKIMSFGRRTTCGRLTPGKSKLRWLAAAGRHEKVKKEIFMATTEKCWTSAFPHCDRAGYGRLRSKEIQAQRKLRLSGCDQERWRGRRSTLEPCHVGRTGKLHHGERAATCTFCAFSAAPLRRACPGRPRLA